MPCGNKVKVITNSGSTKQCKYTPLSHADARSADLVGVADVEILQGKESPVTLISWHSSKTPRVAKSLSAVELQAIGEVDDEMTYVRLVLYETLIAPIGIRRWPTYARRIQQQ